METMTPMIKQYQAIKKQYADCLLFYRMGDFYELFFEDAYTGAQVLNITLTGKSNGKNGKIPMAGVPYHAVDTYLAKLVKAGYKVAICEQLSPPNKKGLVERDVVRIVTPGTLMDEQTLAKKENNYLVSLLVTDDELALAVADISTGYFSVSSLEVTDREKTLQDELAKLSPAECILPDDLYNDAVLLKCLKTDRHINIFPFANWQTYAEDAEEVLQKHFGVKTLKSFMEEEHPLAIEAAAALLGYLQETQKGNISHIQKIVSLTASDGLVLDRATMINLELFATIRDHDTRGSLLTVLDHTITAMGGRLLRTWMKKPLLTKGAIEKRYDAIEVFCNDTVVRDAIREDIKQIPDIERLLSRLAVNLGNGRDIVNVGHALKAILTVKKHLANTTSVLLQEQAAAIHPSLSKLVDHIERVLVDDPPLGTKEGGMIREGVHSELDMLRKTIGTSKSWIMAYEKEEREATGINTLKVRYNKVFGFYIEISKAHATSAPSRYMRKQTLVNGERFITEELKHHEEIILTAEEKINEIEYQLFVEILSFVLSFTQHIQQAGESIATIDCLSNFASLSQKYGYVRPKLLFSGELRIKDGRHPVVERLLEHSAFVPNDLMLDNISQQLLLITGPNMAGKSVYLRQVALIVLMAQMGCFVPAASAHLSLVDRIFVRSGASDVITSGLSTFMVEMVETAHILNNATEHSLIVMDEIGRGTSTYDGISLAWAVAEYLVTHFKQSPKTLFATHYHELQALEKDYPKHIKNFHMAVTQQHGQPIFLHTILPGGASHSFGVAVAKLAGIPQPVIEKAYEILQTLEFRDVENGKQYFTPQHEETASPDAEFLDHVVVKDLEQLDIATLTPLEALNILARLKEKLKLSRDESAQFSDVD